MSEKIIKYYNKFNENKRLQSRHGQVEFFVTLTKLQEVLKSIDRPKILDVGAGTGKYSIALNNLGYTVTAVELVKHNLEVFHTFNQTIEKYEGNALDLSRFANESFDVVLLFGPMYHLFKNEDKFRALSEAKRVVKTGGYIFIAYCLNDYAVMTYGFRDGNIKRAINEGKINENFTTHTVEDDLYSYDTFDNVNLIAKASGLKRFKIFTPDALTDFVREAVKHMDDETFELYKKYVLSISERQDIIGAGSHVVDVLKK